MAEEKVVDTTPAEAPAFDSMEGRYVRLEKLTDGHIPELWHHYNVDDSTFAFLPGERDSNCDEFAAGWQGIQDEGCTVFAMMANPKHLSSGLTPNGSEPNAGRQALGTVIYGDINKKHRTVEVGAIFGPAVRRSAAATEAHYLLLRNIFDPKKGPGYRRVSWKTNSTNKASQRAAERMGYVHEGTWRNHMIDKGRSRDSAWYSMIDDDWPVIREAFEKWLDSSNFDESGKQKRRLEDIRESLKSDTPA